MAKIEYSESFLDFLNRSDNKIANILLRIWSKYYQQEHFGYHKKYKSSIITNEYINYITFRMDKTISYLPAGKPYTVTEDGTWARSGRQNGAPARVIRKLFTKQGLRLFKDSDFETFTNEYKAKYNTENYTFNILPNKAIKGVYNESLHCSSGSLGGSCMNGDGCYLDIYTHCNDLEIVVLRDNRDRLCGRALLWTLPNGEKFIDRFYVFEDFMYQLFLEFSEENEFIRKKNYRSFENKDEFVDHVGEHFEADYKIKLDTNWDHYPYIDTFSYGGDGWLSNDYNSSWDYEYCYTHGDREPEKENYDDDDDEDDDDGRVWDDIRDCYIDEHESIYINSHGLHHGRTTHEDYVHYVNHRYYHVDDANIIEINNRWHLKEDCVEIDDEWYLEDDNDIVLINDDYYLKTDDDVIELHGTYYLKSDNEVVIVNDEYYHEDDVVYSEPENDYILVDEAINVDDLWYHQDSENLVVIGGIHYNKNSKKIRTTKTGRYKLVKTI